MNRFFAALVLALSSTAAVALAGVSSASPAASASPAPSPTPNAAVMDRAKTWFDALRNNTVDRSQLTAKMNSLMTADTVKQVGTLLAPLGKPTAFEQVQTGSKDGSTYYVYQVTFASGDKWLYVFAFDPSTSKVSGLRVLPAP